MEWGGLEMVRKRGGWSEVISNGMKRDKKKGNNKGEKTLGNDEEG